MFPDLTSFRLVLLVLRTKITAFDEDYQQPAAPERCAQSRRIPEWLFANRLGHRQVIHIPQHRRHKSHKNNVWLCEKFNQSSTQSRPSHPRASTSCKTGASMARSKDCQPSQQMRTYSTGPFSPHFFSHMPFSVLRRVPFLTRLKSASGTRSRSVSSLLSLPFWFSLTRRSRSISD